MTNDLSTILSELQPIQDSIAKSESESILDRWRFGRVLVEIRGDKKQLPNGMRADIAKYFINVDASEITRRMQLAEKFPTEAEVVHACKKHGGAWRRIISEELVKRREPKQQSPWAGRAKARLDRMLTEAGEDDARHAELVELLRTTLAALTDADAEVAA